jgi:nitroimidazol reductase NimA-like FMN-containing flavoprotein (pyridoxamine 5'-phosphate oxidase superfamily)
MLESMKELLKQNDLCVLATCLDNQPHASLMSYITDVGGRMVYMVTHRTTKKWANLTLNPRVSLLVDTLLNDRDSGRSGIKAITVYGTCQILHDKEAKQSLLQRLVEWHPHLRPLAYHPDAEVLAIQVESFLLLDGVSDAHFEMIQ